ncbi:MAG: hypothetical protein K6E76_05575 [Patescibacteria group bacterium]|nr:hypothetical protein [Patescibacteria group bacterium]
MIFDDWLDPQLRYIITNLTKMNLTVKWPNFNKYSDAVKNISKGYTDFKESLQKSKKTQT